MSMASTMDAGFAAQLRLQSVARMSPEQFIKKWRHSTLKERSASQSHFNDLCALLGEPTPTDADPDGTWYTFERGAKKTGGGDGWADVWKRGCCAWEYKGKHKDLTAAFAQLQRYAIALENPPLLIVSDMDSIVIHTNFTNTVQEIYVLTLDDLQDPDKRRLLKWAFTEPERLKPGITTLAITEKAARQFAELAQTLRDRGFEAQRVAHYLNKLLFCMFAEDADLLPQKIFTKMLETAVQRPQDFVGMAQDLFRAMQNGGRVGFEAIEWFNGGLFDGDDALPLQEAEIKKLLNVARMDWSAIEPSIFGTLFERGLDPDKRSQLGAHYTDPVSIMRIVQPVVIDPLLAEWEDTKPKIKQALEKYAAQKGAAKSAKAKPKALVEAENLYQHFLERLKNYRVLDPACGSGNFLYLALQHLKDLEHRVMLEAEEMGLHMGFPGVGPECVLGIELNPYAAELARVTVWIGDIQWTLRHGFSPSRNPILKKLDQIQCRDAVMDLMLGTDITLRDEQGNIVGSEGQAWAVAEPEWPTVDAIIGNPPFLGGSKLLRELGNEYTEALRDLYKGRVPGGADLVTYWFEKARAHIEQGKARFAGLVATQAIRAGSNRKVLERILNTPLPQAGEGQGERGNLEIFDAWSDENWVNEGAAVRVSLVCFAGAHSAPYMLDGRVAAVVHADLTAGNGAGGMDLTQAKSLNENAGVSFEGTKKYGDFDVAGDIARQWLKLPNPNQCLNADVVKPWANGKDITGRWSDTWIIDFGMDMPEQDAALYEIPFSHVLEKVKPQRKDSRWWLHERPRPELRKALTGLTRYIVTPRVAKHRMFAFLPARFLPDTRLNVITRSDDTTFGILHSRVHEVWALAQGSIHGDGNEGGRPTYNAKSCFETFPFPEGLTPNLSSPPTPQAGEGSKEGVRERIAAAAKNLNELRENWLNPPEWVDWVRTNEEEQANFPARPVAKPGHEAELKKRTLTNLYNQRPAWLDNAHKELDQAVAAAYGWAEYTPEMPDEEILRRLLALNLQRSGSP